MEIPATTLPRSPSAADQGPGMPIFARSGRHSRTRLLMPHFECFDSRDAVAAGHHTMAPWAKVTIDERVSEQAPLGNTAVSRIYTVAQLRMIPRTAEHLTNQSRARRCRAIHRRTIPRTVSNPANAVDQFGRISANHFPRGHEVVGAATVGMRWTGSRQTRRASSGRAL
jgi:hypothetical protein